MTVTTEGMIYYQVENNIVYLKNLMFNLENNVMKKFNSKHLKVQLYDDEFLYYCNGIDVKTKYIYMLDLLVMMTKKDESMRFKEYLTELKTIPEYEEDWFIRGIDDEVFVSYLHVSKTKSFVNTTLNEPGYTNFQLIFKNIEVKGTPVYFFKFTDEQGNTNATSAVNDLSYKVFGSIEHIFEKTLKILPQDSLICFGALKIEQNRIKIYDRLFNKIKNSYTYTFTDKELRKHYEKYDDMKLYGFTNSKKIYFDIKGIFGIISDKVVKWLK